MLFVNSKSEKTGCKKYAGSEKRFAYSILFFGRSLKVLHEYPHHSQSNRRDKRTECAFEHV